MLNLEKHDSNRVNGYSSKGNLPKWLIGNKWYKLDVFGYESLAEYMVSHLMLKSNVENFVVYDIRKLLYRGEKNACISENFLKKDEELVTIERMHFAEKGVALIEQLLKYKDIKDKILYAVDFVKSYTKLPNFHIYLTKILELDMFFLNEDRHTNNIALIRNINSKKFKYAPLFDNGLSLLSALDDYSMSVDVYKNIEKVKSKPFSTDFYLQVEAIENLYEQQIRLSFDKNDINEYLSIASEYYSNEIIERVRVILYEQMRKYSYLFKR